MKGYTENNIVVLGNPNEIFDLTNDVKQWSELFDEYEKVDVLRHENNVIVFKLTTGTGKSWISERKVNRTSMMANAKRIEPLFPFKEMSITWKYEELPQEIGVIMTWIQEFEVDPKCSHDVYDMESYLNRTTRHEMKSVKQNVERILHEKS